MAELLDRIAQIAKNEKLTITGLEKKIGASKGVLSRAITFNTDIQAKWIEKIVENYPQYSGQWILTGEGPMLKTNEVHPIEQLADRLSQIILDLEYEKMDNIAQCFGITSLELGNFTNNFIFPSHPFDFVRFIIEYPEYNYPWILTGIGPRFNINEETALKTIKQRIYERNHPEYFPAKKGSYCL